jgi:glycosyltransferase involved in cell wall biosynthesis
MAAPPRVSVIMATWNWSSVLPFSIGSVLRQDMADFELLVVGDGCTDDSEAVVKAIGDPRVQWVNLPERSGHQSMPNNEGLRRARGDYIAYLGHDDLWLPHHLACLTAALEAGADVAYAMARLVGAQGGGEFDSVVPDYRPGWWLPPSSVVHRRSLAERTGGWADYRTLAEDPDSELWSRFHASGARFRLVPRLTVIKFPAAQRKDVYRERPCHEQAAWSARIAAGEAVEAEELAQMLLRAKAQIQPKRFQALLGEVGRRSVNGLLGRFRDMTGIRRPLPAGQRIERQRRFKGAAGNDEAARNLAR